MVAKVIGAGFNRSPNAQYFTLRFPRIVKIHNDRSVQSRFSKTLCRLNKTT